jgi:hypothetical protein
MVAYSFKDRFAGPILNGTKGGTIRASRGGRGHARPGEMLQLYTGMRTEECQHICDRKCLATSRILLNLDSMGKPAIIKIYDGASVCRYRGPALDGFADFAEMAKFWFTIHGPGRFDGWHIRWLPLLEAWHVAILDAPRETT